ncbi:MAG: UDP-N-acetylmuramoyl-L-alanine--D-glutamate ligase [Erysipelotrichaceae bacterium]|nr:UDP-N-acetylmuramoyl-L-alanine--D-glutamate ligase [Erysipelotrichaceae bacterium]
MNKNNLKYFNILAIITLALLVYTSLSNDLLTSNLSRNANYSIIAYVVFITLCILFGIMMFISLKAQGFNKLAYLGLVSLLIGGIIPYNYLDSLSINSNLHLICAYISVGLTFVLEITSLYFYERINKKVNRVFKLCLFIIGLYVIYQFGSYLYINTVVELSYLGFIIVSQMIIVNSIIIKDMKVLVIGAALSGSEVSKLLVKKGYEVILTDAKEINNKKELEDLGVKVFDGGHPDFLKDNKYEFVVKNPGIKYDTPFVKYFVDNKVPVLNEIEAASRFVNYKYGAITGTNGKTTTTTLLGEILKNKYGTLAKTCGNIGYPLSTIVNDNEDKELYIALEISGFQLLACPDFKPNVTCIMNLSPDHLDYYDSLDDYYDSKCLIYKNQDINDFFIRNIDDEEIVKRTNDVNCNVINMSIEKEADLCVKENSVYYKDVELFNVSDLKLVGKHNLTNAMVASCMSYLLGVDVETIRNTIKDFKGVEHRLEFVREIDNVKYYNDSKGTNVDSTIVALKSFDKPVILLAGGHDKHTGFNEIIPYLNKVKYMFAYGETKNQLKEIYPEAILVNDLKEAVLKARDVAKEGDVILLSPMCSSYDQFKNFEQRGEVFKEIVNNL